MNLLNQIKIQKSELSWQAFRAIPFNRLDILEVPIWPLSAQLIVIAILTISFYAAMNQSIMAPIRQEIKLSLQQESKLIAIGELKKRKIKQLQSNQGDVIDLNHQNSVISQSLPKRKQLATLLTSINQAALASNLSIKQLNWAESELTPHFEIWPMEIELLGRFFDIQTFIQKVAAMPSLLFFVESEWQRTNLANNTIHLNARLYAVLAIGNSSQLLESSIKERRGM